MTTDSRLAQRIGDSRAAQAAGTSLARAGARPTNVMQLFQYAEYRKEMGRVLNDPALVRRMLQFGLSEVQRIPELAECSWQSVAGALMQCAATGLEPGPALGLSWILPFKREATFVVGYPGVVQLAWRTGQVADVNAERVCEGEDFMFDSGANLIVHKRPTRGLRAAAYAYYSIVRYVNGGRHIEFMTREEVEAHAQRHSKSYQSQKASSPWRTNFDEMAEKTCVLQGRKYMPSSAQWTTAVGADERVSLWTPGSNARPEGEPEGLAEGATVAVGPPEGVTPPTLDQFERLPENGNG